MVVIDIEDSGDEEQAIFKDPLPVVSPGDIVLTDKQIVVSLAMVEPEEPLFFEAMGPLLNDNIPSNGAIDNEPMDKEASNDTRISSSDNSGIRSSEHSSDLEMENQLPLPVHPFVNPPFRCVKLQ
ncbi:hypothetical protein AMTR_s00007p00266180 [Amborella trichopoda]|uniref:Uncharacterized protein n=1 Tax=Amborella trichopoda TaxID=13333 RepID=W1PCX5_AMBTC|nr:hypothetical protein AMTR_s00007p00266180 [Amborella trichopoda]